MADYSNGFGAIFRQAFVGKRGNLADALFAIADAISRLAAAQQNMHADAACVCPPSSDDGHVSYIHGACPVHGTPRP